MLPTSSSVKPPGHTPFLRSSPLFPGSTIKKCPNDMTTMASSLDFARREVNLLYEHKIKELEEFWKRKLLALEQKIVVDNEFNENDVSIRVQTSGLMMQKAYEKKLKKFERGMQQAFDNFQKRQLILEGALDESRRGNFSCE
jgi:hypothetical protein